MIARISNAQMRGQSKVSTPASKMRARVLDVLQTKATSAATPGRKARRVPEFEIELKYFDGQPVIGEIAARLQARPPRLFVDQGPEAGEERPRDLDPVDAQGRDVRHAARDANVGGEVLCRVF